MSFLEIRKDLLPIKIHFFLLFAGISPVLVFLPTYTKQLGLSAALVGTLYTVLPLSGMLAKLILSAIADRFQCHKGFVLFFLLSCTATLYSLMYVPPISKTVQSSLVCKSTSSFVEICSPKKAAKSDNCAVMKIKMEHAENSTTTCSLLCTVDREFLYSVCESWNSSDYCDVVTNKLDKTKSIRRRRSTDISNVNSLSTPSASVDSYSELRFSTTLYPHEVQQDGQCLLIGMGGMKALDRINGTEYFPQCENSNKTIACEMVCDSSTVTEMGESTEKDSTTTQYQFWILVLLMISGWIAMSTISCLTDTICFNLLGDNPSEFGKQRLWGSLGWGVLSILAGLLVDEFSHGKANKNYTPMFYTTAIFLLLDLTVAIFIKETKRKQSKDMMNMMSDIGNVLTNVRIFVFLVWVALMGMAIGIIGNFLFWYLEDLSDCNGLIRIKTMQGLYVTMQTFCGELPFFFMNPWVMKNLGHVNSMTSVLFVLGIMFILYSILGNPWYFLPISVLHGVAFSTLYATMTSYASIIAPPGTEATIQALVGSVYEGIGVSFGTFLAGLLMHYFDGAIVFRMYGIAFLALCGLHIVVQLALGRSEIVPPKSSLKDSRPSVQYTSPGKAIQIME